MTLTEYTIRNKIVSWTVTLLLVVGGLIAFLGLGRLEDPEFTIKKAVVVTAYPGASAREVEEELTLPIENAIQQLPYVDHITSISSAGLSQVTVEMKSFYRKHDLAQIWDEMRRKIRDMEAGLPPGAAKPTINDDFADVYGMYFAVTGEGYDDGELADYADFLRRELVLVEGVGKVAIGGRRQQQVVLEINRAKLSALNLPPSSLRQLLQAQNLVSDAGRIRVGNEYMRIQSTTAHQSVADLANLMLGRAGGRIIYLSDVANLSKSYQDPPSHLYRFNGRPGLTLGVSFTSGVNVVEIGKALRTRLSELESERPIGMSVSTIYDQPAQVEKSVNAFLVGLAQAVAIVIVVLLVAMGLRSGILMSAVLLLTILGTFIVMKIAGIELHRISLGALIIALGMLVDNAIVITEGILIGLRQGLTRLEAANRIVSHTRWPLLGATVISVTAFAPIGLSPDASGEFTGALFWVLLVSLLISWVMAITLTPFFAFLMFKDGKAAEPGGAPVDPYHGALYELYRSGLLLSLRFRWITLALIGLAMATAVFGFRYVNQAFFPESSLPVFVVEYWLPEGSDIRATRDDLAALETEIRKLPAVKQVTTTIGRGAMRFMLTYTTERSYASYGQLIIEARNFDEVAGARADVDRIIRERAPQAFSKSARINIGPASKSKIEARISGPDRKELRRLAGKIEKIFRADPDAVNIRHDWRDRSKVLRPRFAEAEARRLGISKTDLDQAIALSTSGVRVGLYRDGTSLLPIILRLPARERSNVAQLGEVRVYSASTGAYVGIDQVTTGIDLAFEDPLIMRRDRKRTIQVWADPDPNGPTNSFALFNRLRPQAEAVKLPVGYNLTWGGEYESQQRANKAVFEFVPLGIVVMVMINIFLFNSLRKTLVIWLTVPLALIGVTTGLLVMNQPFSFTALLGFLSLSGMVIKNGIVLVEEITRLNDEEGETMHDAITRAAVSRLRPVSMAAITTILGLIPLLSDVFFAPLSVTIMFGLGFATILTLIVVPVLFSLFYRVHFHRGEAIG